MLEERICPLCNAFQDPDTGKCLVCGKHYHVLDIPNAAESEPIGDFIVPLSNGFLTFKASVEMTIEENTDTIIDPKCGEILIPPTYKAKITFHFLPDENNTLCEFCGGRHFN